MECRGELCMTTTRSSLSLSSLGSVTSSESRAYPRSPIILQQMDSRRPSTKPSPKSSRSSSPRAIATETRNWESDLLAYRTTVRTPTKATPFSLVYGCEAVLSLEIQIPSLRIAIASGMTEEEKDKQRLAQLEELNEKRLKAQQMIELYQARMARAYNKGIRLRTFKKGELVLMVRRPMEITHKSKGKFQPKWEGPFVIETVYSNGAYRLTTMEGDVLMMPINGKYLKKYYA